MKKATVIYGYNTRLKKLFFLLLFIPLFSSAQNYPKDFFRFPVDTVVRLAGNFGEIRHDHFHYGWDIRTGGHEGMKVVAAGDGYVSRIKAGPYSYGKVIYITHPNGYVTVYAHLSAFNDSIGALVKKEQYKNESYEVEIFPKPGELKVKKGEFIALSGNTGFSEAPHLHFEIRDEKTEEIINPYFFGLRIADTIKPVFKTLAIYPKGNLVNGNHVPYYISLEKKKGKYQFQTKDSVVVTGQIGFGIEVYDKANNSNGNNQVYSLEFQLDGKRIYYYEMTRFAFDQTLYVNAHIDYKAQRKDNKNIQKAFLLPGNKFPIYKDIVNSGIVSFDKDTIHTGKFIAKDYYGNTSEFSFKIIVKGQLARDIPDKNKLSVKYETSEEMDEALAELNCRDDAAFIPVPTDKEFHFTDTLSYKINIPANSFYENYIYTQCKGNRNKVMVDLKKKIPRSYSLMYQIYGKYVPIHHKYSLSLKLDTTLSDSLKSKLVIVSVNEKGKVLSTEGGEFKDGWVTTETRDFGNFIISIDSTKPKIKAPVLPKGNKITAFKTIDFKVADNLTGIKSYRVTLDENLRSGEKGKWILFEYEPKKDIIFCKNDDRLPTGKHKLTVEVTDGKGNRSTIRFSYVK